MKLSDSGIVWEGGCDKCKARGYTGRPTFKHICPNCGGTKVITRDATLEEVTATLHDYLIRVKNTSFSQALTIHGGILKIKEETEKPLD